MSRVDDPVDKGIERETEDTGGASSTLAAFRSAMAAMTAASFGRTRPDRRAACTWARAISPSCAQSADEIASAGVLPAFAIQLRNGPRFISEARRCRLSADDRAEGDRLRDLLSVVRDASDYAALERITGHGIRAETREFKHDRAREHST